MPRLQSSQYLLLILGCILFLLQTSNALSIGKQRRINIIDGRFNTKTLPPTLTNRRLNSLGSPLYLAADNSDDLTTTDESSLDNHIDSSVSSVDSVSTKNDTVTATGKSFQPFKFLRNIKSFNKQSISKMGMSALLSYGFVSNVSGVLAVSSAWFIFSKRVSDFQSNANAVVKVHNLHLHLCRSITSWFTITCNRLAYLRWHRVKEHLS